MRRIKTVLGVVAVMAAMLVAFAAPALANDHNDWDWDERHDDFDSCWFFGFWVCDDDRDHDDDDDAAISAATARTVSMRLISCATSLS